MEINKNININIKSIKSLPVPSELRKILPIREEVEKNIQQSRDIIKKILNQEDKRLLIVVGPCSIDNTKAALEYAKKLRNLKSRLGKIFIVMRTYLEKPRTTTGWKGFVNDPYLDGSHDMAYGLREARKLLINLAEDIPTATEALDPFTIHYFAELLSWVSIGARTSESQPHREMASGLSMPVGFKNSTDGGIEVAINAIESAKNPHCFLGINNQGVISMVKTIGNSWGHLILRGGKNKTNYNEDDIKYAVERLKNKRLATSLIVDCSHDNSQKKSKNQIEVFEKIVEQRKSGNTNIVGVMLESYLYAGNQKIPADLSQLKYGVSVTDECLDWETTEKLLIYANENL